MTQNNKPGEEKKIIIDEDWKTQAQREKEAAAAAERAEREKKAAEESNKRKQARNIPPASFNTLVSMLSTQAFFAMGLIGTEQDKENPPEPDLPLAKHSIDTLEILEEKTKNNLTEEEQQTLSAALHQLRMAYVQVSK